MPKEKYDIALDTMVLDRLGISYELGQTITLEYTLMNEKVVDNFKLVGVWEGDSVIPASMIGVSPSYGEDKLKDYVSVQDNDPIGTLDATVFLVIRII